MIAALRHALPWEFWAFVTRFGEAQLMAPTALVLGVWLAWIGARHSARVWLALFGIAFALTAATKIAFIGWGVGIPRINFTGISGHAMHASAVLPMLAHSLLSSSHRSARSVATALCYLLAALVALSRVVIGAHSASEVAVGFALGGAASALTIVRAQLPERALPHALAAVLVAAQLLNAIAAPSVRTHDFVTRVALVVSGHDKPYTRAMLRQRGDCWIPDWTTAQGRACS